MVVGGASDEKVTDKAYAISLKSSVAVPSCLEYICDMRNYVYAAISAIFEDRLPTICGGRKNSPSTYDKECYKFNYSDAWDPVPGGKNYFSALSGVQEA